jgi:transcriptional regulator with XRE-family HTH domain
MSVPESEFVGDRIRRLREAQGLSQMGLRRLSGLSPTTIYRAEVGGVVTPKTAAKLAEIFRCKTDELLPMDCGDALGRSRNVQSRTAA